MNNKAQQFALNNDLTPEIMNVLVKMLNHGRSEGPIALNESALTEAMEAGFVGRTEKGLRITDHGYVILRRLAMHQEVSNP